MPQQLPSNLKAEQLGERHRSPPASWERSALGPTAFLRNKPDIYRDYTRERFEQEVPRHFRVESVTGTKAGLRWLYHLRAEPR